MARARKVSSVPIQRGSQLFQRRRSGDEERNRSDQRLADHIKRFVLETKSRLLQLQFRKSEFLGFNCGRLDVECLDRLINGDEQVEPVSIQALHYCNSDDVPV